MSKVMLIVNPSSGHETAGNYAEVVIEKLEEKFDEVTVRYTEKKWDAARFSKQAVKKQYDSVFALGGDGTVNECINGMAGEDKRPIFGFIPMGTVNDLGRVLGIPMDPNQAIEEIPEMTTREIDVGKVNDTYFVDILAVGTLPEAVQEVPIEQKTKLGPFAYILEGIKSLRENKAYPYRVDLDHEKSEFNSFLLMIALTNSIAGIPTMIPEASVDDGYLHCIAITGEKIMDKLDILPKVFTGNLIEDEHVFYKSFKKGVIQVADDHELTINVDGDKGSILPIQVEILPQHITCYVPKESN